MLLYYTMRNVFFFVKIKRENKTHTQTWNKQKKNKAKKRKVFRKFKKNEMKLIKLKFAIKKCKIKRKVWRFLHSRGDTRSINITLLLLDSLWIEWNCKVNETHFCILSRTVQNYILFSAFKFSNLKTNSWKRKKIQAK